MLTHLGRPCFWCAYARPICACLRHRGTHAHRRDGYSYPQIPERGAEDRVAPFRFEPGDAHRVNPALK